MLAQVANWSWEGGDIAPNVPGIYGNKGSYSQKFYPGARSSSISWTDADGSLWLFGGQGYGEKSGGYLNDLWNYIPGKNEWAWISGDNTVNMRGDYGKIGNADPKNKPGGRYGAVSWIDTDGNLWLFGGVGYAGAKTEEPGFLNDLWIYYVKKKLWVWMSGTSVTNNVGEFGRKLEASMKNLPCARMGAVSWIDIKGVLWLHGGVGPDVSKFGDLNDLWKFDVNEGWTWESGDDFINAQGIYGTQGKASKENKPGGRFNAVSWIDLWGRLWLFGGIRFATKDKLAHNDLWNYNTEKHTWEWISGDKIPDQPGVYASRSLDKKNVPGARGGAVSWLDASNNLWMFGGNVFYQNGGLNSFANDLWMYDIKRDQWAWVSGDNIPNQDGIYGTKHGASPSNKPGARNDAVSWIDKSGSFWLFGGENMYKEKKAMNNELWKFSPLVFNCPGKITVQTSQTGCEAIVNKIDPVISGDANVSWIFNIKGATTANGKGEASGQTFNKGLSTVTYGIPHYEGLACSFDVIVEDKTLPVPNLRKLGDIIGECFATVPKPSAYDNCDGKVEGVTSSPLTYTKKGTYTIQWYYKDIGGNVDSQLQRVIINDTTPPVPDLQSLPVLTFDCSTVIVPPTAKDGCNGIITGKASSPFIFNGQGIYNIKWAFTDSSGNTTTQTQVVIIKDSIPPLPVLKDLPDINGDCFARATNYPTATDNCNGIITATTVDALYYTGKGTHTITWLFQDSSGNKVTQEQRLIIFDKTPPVPKVKLLPNIVAECSFTITTPTATDNCSGVVMGIPEQPIVFNGKGSYIINWIYKDSSGNRSNQEQSIILSDDTPPVPVLKELPGITADCATTILPPTAIDNCNGKIVGRTSSPIAFDGQGVHTITWIFKDSSGNTSTQSQQVIIRDTTAPIPGVDALPDVITECSVNINSRPTATDNCNGTITATTKDPLVYDAQGIHVIRWLYKDASGNVTMQLQKVVVKDTQPPVPNLSALPELTGSCSLTVDTKPTATDNCSGTITGTTTNPLVYNNLGTYTILWTFKDANGNLSTQQQKVLVQASSRPIPTLSILPELKGECSINATVIPSAIGSCSGTTISATTADPISYNRQGSYIIHWTYRDEHGNTATQEQIVTIKDQTAPVPVSAPLPDITGACSVEIKTIPKADDNCSGIISAITSNPLSYNAPGNYTIDWVYKDANGNTASQQQKIVIKDQAAPVPDVNALPDMTDECSVIVKVYPAATDNCSGKIIGTTTDPISFERPGNYTINWLYKDASGNSVTQQQKVIIRTSTGPVPLAASLPDITAECAVTVTGKPIARDRCGNLITGTTEDPLTYTLPGKRVITWKYVDASGNATTQKQNVTVTSLDLSLNVFPNPTKNNFTVIVKSCDRSRIITLNVFDVMGRQVYNQEITAYATIKFGSVFPSGSYFLLVSQGPERLIRKIFKMK